MVCGLWVSSECGVKVESRERCRGQDIGRLYRRMWVGAICCIWIGSVFGVEVIVCVNCGVCR